MTAAPPKLEHQRLDGNGDGAGGFQDIAEVDEVEILKRDTVDGEDVVLDVEIVSKNIAHQAREIVIEDEIDCRLLTHTADRPSSDRKGRLTRPA